MASRIRRLAGGVSLFAIRTLVPLLVFSGFQPSLRATWSITAVDQNSRRVAIASATCVPQRAFARFPAKGLMDVQAIVVPGVGVAAAQARVDRSRQNQQLIFREMRRGTPPDRIIQMLKEDEAIEGRQFGIVDLQGRSAGFSGQENGKASLDRQGMLAERGIIFSIQGNILAGDQVVEEAMAAFREASGDLLDRIMAAMEAADAAGGDRRCSCDSEPKTAAPCQSKTAHVAYLLQAGPEDSDGDSFNDGDYEVYLSVDDRNIRPDEDANPVKTLRLRYQTWKSESRR